MNADGHLARQFGHHRPVAAKLLPPFPVPLRSDDLGKEIDVSDADILQRDDREMPPRCSAIVLEQVGQRPLRQLGLRAADRLLEATPSNVAVARQGALHWRGPSGDRFGEIEQDVIEQGVVGKHHRDLHPGGRRIVLPTTDDSEEGWTVKVIHPLIESEANCRVALVSRSRHAAPMFVDIDNRAQALAPVRLGQTPDEDRKRREAFIQNLIHDHPSLIPMTEIEPAFSPLIPVCKELPTPAGYLDHLWVTPWGGLVLGEAKLVRNPQARREVVAQALDYARAVADWTFDDLEAAVRTALRQPAFSLWSLVQAETDLEEEQFVDAVERRLRAGRLLLLIIGDGIQEGVEALTAHLQLHAGLHVGLALLDLSLWRNVDGGLIVVPRVPMRTVLIERGIVQVEASGVRIVEPAARPGDWAGKRPPRPASSSEGEFYDHLAAKRPDLVAPLRALLDRAEMEGVRPEIGRTIRLILPLGPEQAGTAGYIETNGKVWMQGAWAAARRMERVEIGEAYLATVADIIGGSIRRYEKAAPEVISADGHGTDLGVLLASTDRWLQAVVRLRDGLAAGALPDHAEQR